ncbi:acyltransferase [Stenotrophomonas sp. MMGLT7]|uniref:LpxL/LpxP family acyltransferase n=1 Tax=Stenotrophomonas sp. MMGLT7 TaxID=2901227 RepID=UPI001E44508F|nr:acyltransferase [Stenotrophomonas sp. MMGLT7]MCD7099863.1 acyltransferase [Stenotrophomonas sp. MMGLT7]
MSASWKQRPEGGSRLALWLIRGIARHGGRGIGRLLLYPITLYFLATRAPERRDSREYLGRVFGRPAKLREVARHIHTFAATILDRVFLLGGQLERFRIEVQGLDQLRAQMDKGRGVLVFGSHLGSFDALRVLAAERPDVQVKVVLDKAHNPALTDMLCALNPQLAANIIDAGMDSTSIVMAIKQAADEGALVALLVDRLRPEDPALPAPFIGQGAMFPTSPWLIAAVLKLPVVLAFGLYRGGNRYQLTFETFSEGLDLPRRQRAPAVAALICDYAARLEHYTRSAPYNWFNFYDFWNTHHADASYLAVDADTAVQRRTAVRRTV